MSSAATKSSGGGMDKDVQNDLGQLKDDLAQLKQDMTSMASEAYGMARERFSQAVDGVKERGVQAKDAFEEHVQENPWRTVGIAFGVGLLVGLVIRGRG